MRSLLFFVAIMGIYLSAFSPANSYTVQGRVTQEGTGTPLQGVTVTVKGTKTTTVTGTDGHFSLLINSSPAKLLFSCPGYDQQELTVKNEENNLQVKLKVSVVNLQKVVVTGHATQRKRDLTGSVTYSTDNKYAPPVASELAGKSSGVNIQRIDEKGKIPFRDKNRWNQVYNQDMNTEEYDGIVENRFLLATENPLSTFSIDVDGASYANARRYLQMGQLPPPGSVRIEEFINYFHYDYPQPKGEAPFSINTEVTDCPWNHQNKLLMIGLQGKTIPTDNLPASNLVFLIDVSGSMMEPNKLPLVKSSLKLLVDQLREQDKVALVVYAGNAGQVLPSTRGSEKQKIKDAIDQLEAGGSTAGGAGIQLAYKVAKDNFINGANNRVILCTDGDFNVGLSSDASLEKLIEEERNTGVFLTVLGYGMGNYKDSKMQKLADKGNGNHAYIDNFSEARKVLVNEFGGTLFTIAKDVKLQVEFNPARVSAYRLVGYENRMLNKEDFNNDKKDAGDLGSGHTVTALYEIIPAGVESEFIEKTDPLKYQAPPSRMSPSAGDELLTIKFRYKKPDGNKSSLIVETVMDRHSSIDKGSENFRFVAAVAEFGMVLRSSEFKQGSSYQQAWELASHALGKDQEGYRSEFLKLLRNAESLARKTEVDESTEDVGKK